VRKRSIGLQSVDRAAREPGEATDLPKANETVHFQRRVIGVCRNALDQRTSHIRARVRRFTLKSAESDNLMDRPFAFLKELTERSRSGIEFEAIEEIFGHIHSIQSKQSAGS
jgi:hypothetical protein